MSDTAKEFIAFGRTYRNYMTPYCYKYSNKTVRNEAVPYTLIENARNMYWSFQTT